MRSFVVLNTNTFEEMNHPHLLHFSKSPHSLRFVLELSMFFPASHHVVIEWKPPIVTTCILFLSSVGVWGWHHLASFLLLRDNDGFLSF